MIKTVIYFYFYYVLKNDLVFNAHYYPIKKETLVQITFLKIYHYEILEI